MEITTIAFLPVILLSILALWKEIHILFMITSGVALMTGLHAPDIISGNYQPLGFATGLALISYSLLCIGWTFRLLFWKGSNA